jgi:hypothetical protein
MRQWRQHLHRLPETFCCGPIIHHNIPIMSRTGFANPSARFFYAALTAFPLKLF